jgi:hypothetical protein
MTSAVLFILGALFVSIVLSKVAKYLLTKMQNSKLEELAEKQKQRDLEKINSQEQMKPTEYKKVLNKQNCSSTRKPQDFNDKQNLDTKFSPNVYRGKNGRFKSKKEWNKEQKIS